MLKKAGELIDFRTRARSMGAPEAVRFAPCSPNLQILRDLCCGVCRTWSEAAAAVAGDELPASVTVQIEAAVVRTVGGVESLEISPTKKGWTVVFSTESEDPEEYFTFSFSIPLRWAKLESSGV